MACIKIAFDNKSVVSDESVDLGYPVCLGSTFASRSKADRHKNNVSDCNRNSDRRYFSCLIAKMVGDELGLQCVAFYKDSGLSEAAFPGLAYKRTVILVSSEP